MLEALVHTSASFVTLTYNKEHLPPDGSLVPRDLQLFLKRLRTNTQLPIRYFGVGEYGDLSWRPHYHLALFGVPREGEPLVNRAWGKGFVKSGDLTMESAQYVAGYVVKKLTRADDPALEGRYPEFARMSLRPGIGAIAIPDIARALQSRPGWDEIEKKGDVPGVLRHGRRTLPLGRYLLRKLRTEMNFLNTGGQNVQTPEMLAVLQNYWITSSERRISFRAYLQEVYGPKINRIERKQKSFSKTGTI